MVGNSFGTMLRMTTFGESHGPALGVVLEGVPSRLPFSLEELQKKLQQRSPGRIEGTTKRRESDKALVLSGIFEGKTLGTPLAVMIENKDQRPKDYDQLRDHFRPGHGDETYQCKYGIRDHRGGGRSSGRETVARIIAGYVAGLIIKNVLVKAYTAKIGPFEYSSLPEDISRDFSPYHFPDSSQNNALKEYLVSLQNRGESQGGRVAVIVDNCPAGLGDPVFDKLKATLAKALLSLGGCVSCSFGLGENMAFAKGSDVSGRRDDFGGIEGGISNGRRIFFQLVFKPPSTVGEKAREGRHDPCIIPRAVPVVEAMVKFVLADHYLRQKAYENFRDGYS